MNKLTVLITAFLVVVCGCTRGPDIAGTSEQGNARVIASVYTLDRKPAVHATVRLRKKGYVKQPAVVKKLAHYNADTFTDANGAFVIDSLDTGAYNIEVTNLTSSAVLFNCVIEGDGIRTYNLQSDTLRPFAAIKGNAGYANAERYIQIEGLERLVTIDTSGDYLITDLPGGTFTLKSVSPDPQIMPEAIPDIVAHPGDTTLIPRSSRLFSRAVYLNTSASGAHTVTDLYGFPVLIRLSADNFTFGEALPGGKDVRFVKPGADSTPLPCEIERWDVAQQLAEIWVGVDTVFGNSTKESCIMLWGDSTDARRESAGHVFDTAHGFGGVWHFAGPGDVLGRDATPNRFDGKPFHLDIAEGVIGMTGWFAGRKSVLTIANSASGMFNFPENGIYSVSAWVYSEVTSINRFILSKGHAQYNLKLHESKWHFAEYHNEPSGGWQFSAAPYSAKTWTHLCGIRNGTSQYLYVNGECVDSSKTVLSGSTSRIDTFDLEIGRQFTPNDSDGQHFSGYIDEVRVSPVLRSREWVRLCYLNQQRDGLLVQFKKEQE